MVTVVPVTKQSDLTGQLYLHWMITISWREPKGRRRSGGPGGRRAGAWARRRRPARGTRPSAGRASPESTPRPSPCTTPSRTSGATSPSRERMYWWSPPSVSGCCCPHLRTVWTGSGTWGSRRPGRAALAPSGSGRSGTWNDKRKLLSAADRFLNSEQPFYIKNFEQEAMRQVSD